MSGFVDCLVVFDATETVPLSPVTRDEQQPWKCVNKLEPLWKVLISSPAPGKKSLTLSLSTEVEQGPWRLWLVGEVYSYEGCRAKNTTAVLTRFCIDLLEGNAHPETLNGHYLLLGWNDQTNQWHVWTNRMGTLHAYYGTNGKQAALGTFFPAVAQVASKKKLDWSALTGFFAFGFFPQDRTYYDDIRILRPATHYTFDAHGCLLHDERYWHWWHEPDETRSYEDTVDAFGELFQGVLQEQTHARRVALPVSGGLDSRATVAALTAPDHNSGENIPYWGYSYGYTDDSVELRIAEEIAQVRSLPFHRFTIEPYLFEKMEQVMAAVEGFQDITQCRQAFVSDALARNADYVVAAHWGDVWLDAMIAPGSYSTGINQGNLTAFVLSKIQKRGRQWLIDHVCQPHLEENAEVVLRDSVQAELHQLASLQDLDFRIKAYKTDQWSFRWTLASLRMFQAGVFPLLPFYDNRLVDFFCTVPTEFLQGRRLQIDYLKRFAPDLARITWQAWDTNLYRYQHFHTWLLPKRIVKKARRIIRRTPVIQRNWEAQFLHEQGQQGLAQWLLRNGLRLHEWVAPKTVQHLLDAFYAAPTAANGYTVSMLLTFSAWLETVDAA